ncbi:hypothetical protein [Sorangium cellulosum]|nr:hypothetical protein [Sorangium cellulosum]
MLPACAADMGDGESSEIAKSFVEGDDPAELESAQELIGTSSEALTSFSFTGSCSEYIIDFYTDGRVGVPYAYCQRRNGSWRAASWGPGYCSGDLANCDGYIRCGSC